MPILDVHGQSSIGGIVDDDGSVADTDAAFLYRPKSCIFRASGLLMCGRFEPEQYDPLKLIDRAKREDWKSHRDILEIPDGIGDLTSLRRLYLGMNHKLTKLPETIRGLTNFSLWISAGFG